MNRQEQINIYFEILVRDFEKENKEVIEFTGGIPEYYLSDLKEEAVRIVDRDI